MPTCQVYVELPVRCMVGIGRARVESSTLLLGGAVERVTLPWRQGRSGLHVAGLRMWIGATNKSGLQKLEPAREATTGFEPVNTGFANPPLNHLGTSPEARGA